MRVPPACVANIVVGLSTGLRRAKRSNTEGPASGRSARRSPRPRLRQGQHPGTGGRRHRHGLRLVCYQHVHKLLVSEELASMLGPTPGCRFWAPPHTLGGNSLSGAASLPGRWLRGRCSVDVHPLHLRAAALQSRAVPTTDSA